MVKEISASIKSAYYWNLNIGTQCNGNKFFADNKSINFTTDKAYVTWLRILVHDDLTSENVAASSHYFRVAQAAAESASDVRMDQTKFDGTPGADDTYTVAAEVNFADENKSFQIYFGSVNTGTKQSSLTKTVSVSEHCIKAQIIYCFKTNQVFVNELEWDIIPSTTYTWTGAISTAWETAGNWSPAGVPTANDDVIIPANLGVYPVLADNVEVNTLSMEPGASLDLDEYKFSAQSIIAEVVMDSRIPESAPGSDDAIENWYSLGFPFDVNAHCYAYTNSLLTPNTHFWLRYYNADWINENGDAQKVIPAGGYIVQLPSEYAPNAKISFVSGKIDELEKSASTLEFNNDTYIMQTNPGLVPYPINALSANRTVYRLNRALNEYRPTSDPIETFESVITFQSYAMQPAPKISLETDVITGHPHPKKDVVVEARYYNLQGLEIAQPKQGSIYIVKSIYESGETSVIKVIK